jgi:hypothetical protein
MAKKKKKPEPKPSKPKRTLEPGEYPKGQIAHTRGWEPGDPLDTPPTKLLVDGVEQSKREEQVEAYSIPNQVHKQLPAESKPEHLPRSHRISRVLAGGLFALFSGSIIQALTLFGVITMNSGHFFMGIAFVAGVLMITTEILPLRPTRHKVGAIVILGLVLGVIDMAAAWYARKRAAPTPPTIASADKVNPDPSLTDLRNQLRSDSSKPIRDVGFSIKLDRSYSIEELGHFRIIYEVFDMQGHLDFFLACQNLYQVNEFSDRNAKAYGIRCTVEYRASEKDKTFATIPLLGKEKYFGLLDSAHSIDKIERSVDLYNQIPAYKILEDLNRKNLYIFVTAPLADKISEISFKVNYWELVSAKSEMLVVIEDRPIAPWIMPLTKNEKEIAWRGVYLKNLEGIGNKAGEPERVFVWSLDFFLVHPRKLPEPEIKFDPLNPSKPH